ncbi:MAG TPA: DUF1697 domain-containing protein [Caulifigura sp.]|nr:DUF1697 domain-containing protein [Caulifigura sp.]
MPKNSNVAIALLRGINVGGKAIVPMRTLVDCLEELGYDDVRTYIQSGNAVFRSPKKLTAKSAEAITAAVQTACGVDPHVQLLTLAELESVIEGNPFRDGVDDPSRLHVFFLASEPKSPKLEAVETLKAPTERCRLTPRAFYLHAPEGIGRSKLAAALERLLGVPTTARNWRTVEKIREMAGE